MHLTVRMAWHDNNWDGKVCGDPKANTYCTGAHSLLSGRIEKKKDTEKESKKGVKGEYVAKNFAPADVPPCYWSINAFSNSSFKVEHHHAFSAVKHTIPDLVTPYSVYTWPFKLSFVHNKENQQKQGNYPPDLNQRIDDFIHQFTPSESIIFFYANYDNPVSADEMKYLLLGCSVIRELPVPKHFPFSDKELKERRKEKIMKNFPTMNWALQFTHNPKKAVLLPYREYISYAEEHPEDEEKLQDMRVIIEEESLVQGFKYVSMNIDDDKCLYLLYKLRKSIKKIQGHNQVVVNADLKDEENRINALIEMTWKKRGIYPSLSKVLNHFIDNDKLSQSLANAIASVTEPKYDLVQCLEDVVTEEIPDALSKYEDDLLELADNKLFKKNLKSLARLSLFNLTQHQVSKIIETSDLLKAIGTNPYALYEDYLADEDDLDIPQMQDESIDVYKVDVGMIPDKNYVQKHRKIQNLSEDSAERIRSVIINYLWSIGQQGHCYDHTHNLLSDIKEHPLIYKNNITIDEQALIDLDVDYKSHFIEKLHIEPGEGLDFFYLKDIKNAERHLKEIVVKLVSRVDHKGEGINVDTYINECLSHKPLCNIITKEEEKALFKEERHKLYANIFKKSFFLLTGKPGAGKTFETSKVIHHLDQLNEEIEILAPTGKAALRLTENIRKNTGNTVITAKTIDKYIFEKGFGWAFQDWERLEALPEKDKLTVENLVLDECSMIDLQKLTILFSIIRFNDKYPKRVIMVGDENQLPPIGFGKPFHDIINHIIAKENLAEKHYIHLKSNCRQENDEKILLLAEAFTDKRRYYEEALELFKNEGWVSKGLFIKKWETKENLNAAIHESLNELFDKEKIKHQSNEGKLNLLFGLYENGYVNNADYKFKDTLSLEGFQLLTPYRTGFYGALGLNKTIQANYRTKPAYTSENSSFYHSDKIIRINNWYVGWGDKRRLKLSNGSIGIINGEGNKRRFYFKDLEKPEYYVDNEENFDLAYAVSVHKSQGSDFKNVFMVVPNKLSLLSKELIYTALTRSKYRLYIYIQQADIDLLHKARTTSHLLTRNTSVFTEPEDFKRKLMPVEGEAVNSKIEYIIYQSLHKSGLKFKYEQELELEQRGYNIHPDFTIFLKNGKTIYWEHLGMLDTRKYYKDWQKRKQDYIDHGKFDFVVTTDDLEGVKQEKIDALIEAIRENNLKTDKANKFSYHHYELY